MSGKDREPTDATQSAPPQGRSRVLRVLRETAVKSWDESIFGQSGEAAFWQTLSLPPLLLGLLGSLGYISSWFGPQTTQQVQNEILGFSRSLLDPTIVQQIIAPTVQDILSHGRGEIVSVGFLISLWAGSSAMSCFVDAITLAHGQHTIRNEVWQRIFALFLYMGALVIGIVTLPLLALGPDLLVRLAPQAWESTVSGLIERFYYPGLGVLLVLALTTLYKVSLPRKLPWHRLLPGAVLAMIVFLVTSTVLRLYIAWVTTTGYTYGALATPIAFLLFTFFIGLAIILGAQLNHAIEEEWPTHMTHRERRRWRRLTMERVAERLRGESGAPTPVAERHTAPSPADTTPTSPMRVGDGSAPAAKPADR